MPHKKVADKWKEAFWVYLINNKKNNSISVDINDFTEMRIPFEMLQEN